MPKDHALLSASGAHRWLECTPSALLESELPGTTSVYAEEGTVAHRLAEASARWYTNQITDAEYNGMLDEVKQSKYYNEEMLEYCDGYGKFVRDKLAEVSEIADEEAAILVETKIDFSAWVPSAFGTADCLILADNYMEVIDFKYGRGSRVEAEGNPQMRLYALGAYQTCGYVYDVENITMTIYQPRIANGITSDTIDLAELIDWAETYVKPRAALAVKGKGEFAPSGEACKFCKAKATCRARAEKNLELFDDAPDKYLLTVEEAGEILKKASDIESWLSDLKAYVESSLFEGIPVPGWKLVEGKSVRRYADEAKVREALLAAGVEEAILYKPRELVTLTQLEKDVGKKRVAEILGKLIVKPAGKPSLAPESDKRPAVTPAEQLVKQFDD